MELDETVNDREPEPVVPARDAALGLPERLEDMREEIRRDPAAVVGHCDSDSVSAPEERQVDPTARGRELYRVGQKVPRSWGWKSTDGPGNPASSLARYRAWWGRLTTTIC